MPLDPPNLDDRTFQDIVDETKRLIPRFTPEWTNHNVSDPGVALIELFAWVSEMVLYRVNQVPDRMYVHFLNLVGIEPFPPSVARANLTFWLSSPADRVVRIPEGTEVSTALDDADATVFSTAAEAVVGPPTLTTAHTSNAQHLASTDVWDDLTLPGQSAVCFPSSPLAEGDALYLGTRESLAGFAVRLDLAADAQGIGVDPRNPPLAWEAWNGEAWVRTLVESDGTGGLNKAGSVVLLVPQKHEPLVLGGTLAHWLRVRLLRPQPGQPTYQASPRIASIALQAIGITVPAEHASAQPAELLGRSTGVTGQSFTVSVTPVAARRDDERVVVVDRRGTHTWQEVPDFSASGPDDLHVVWDSNTGEVQFGPAIRHPDGVVRQHGAIPQDGAEIRVTGYRSGGGAHGNLGTRTLTALRTALPFVASVTNLEPATGGVDAETPQEAKARGPLTLRTGQRAVTASDFEAIARQASVEVARARCLPAVESGSSVVRVLVVPQLRTDPRLHKIDDFALSSELHATVGAALDVRRMVGVPIELGTPYYQGVSVAALVRTLPGRPGAMVRQRIVDALTRFVHPLTGGADRTGWPFDTTLTATAVTQVIESVEGVLSVDELQLFEYDLRTGRRIGGGRESIVLEPHTLFLSAEHRVVVR
ncbi:putative baseplate assembly protein [Cellulomonas xylanilytica]|uniref:Putative baseplate assembly protein n=1 Tax=Cellulomonas xylanilytica TaxID=233583 RepID=A0A510V689_9CELL|nr:putative baseplate assembly protein [Cellulomonas xylanilytica]GEK21451.1 putative baseplate assembly protein [Cellulomonas xylanilytica]